MGKRLNYICVLTENMVYCIILYFFLFYFYFVYIFAIVDGATYTQRK